MPPKSQSRFWRRVRLIWRGCRIAGLLFLLALLLGLIYLNRAGLPEFAKRPLLEKLRARGLDFEMARLRPSLHRGLVAEDAKFGQVRSTTSPHLTAKTVEVKINYFSLLKRQLQVQAVVLDEGRLVWPLTDSRLPSRELVVENIRANLRLLPGDEWALDHFHATFAGADFTVSGAITNASALRDWPLFQGKPTPGSTQRRLWRLADTLEKIHFVAPPELRLLINGDANDMQSFEIRFTLVAPDADTPWGKISDGIFTARILPPAEQARANADLSLQADAVQTPWAAVTGLNLAANVTTRTGETNTVNGVLNARASRVETQWAGVTNAQLNADWIHSLTNAIPLSGHGGFHAAAVATPWASGREFQLAATLATPANPPPADASWAWWTNLQPFHLDWTCALSQPDTEKLAAEKVVCGGRWRAPALIVTNLHAVFSDGAFDARGQLDVASREAQFDLNSHFDIKKISPLLPEKARQWLGKFSWAVPPKVAGHGDVTLPAWTNRQPDRGAQMQSSLKLAGEVFVTNGAYLGLPVDWAHTHIGYSNLTWHLPDLEIGRPEGGLRLAHTANDRTKDYYWRIHSTVDPRALRPLLDPKEQRGLDLVTFTQPPLIDGEVWGRSHQRDRIGFRGHVAMTNFSIRGQSASHVESAVRYTNRFLEFSDPRLTRGTQALSATGIAVDFNTQRIHFTNGLSTAEPLVVAHAIGPHTKRAIEPYRFSEPPTVRVSGYAPLHGSSDADLHLNVDGGPFAWWKFRSPHVTGDVHWMGESLTLTNARAAFYEGDAAGFAHFDFTPSIGTDFGFTAGVTNVNLPSLLADVFEKTNHLEGIMSGSLVIHHANSEEPHSWNGAGRARLRNGLLWEMPIFGVLSKPLDKIMPGVANSRFSEASGRFTLTNGVIDWGRLEMRAPTMRLQYEGTVDFDGQVDMRVEAEPLRDAWVVGRLFSLALWPVSKLFQYKITGTLDAPKSEPVYVPKLLLMPLHPFQTLEDLFTPDAEKTNTPPVYKEVPN